MTQSDQPITELAQAMTTARITVLQQEYMGLMHGIQSGVEFLKEYDDTQLQPKGLRVGLNGVLCAQGALVKLLCDNGIIQEVDYWEELVKSTREEVERYQNQLRHHMGTAVTLL